MTNLGGGVWQYNTWSPSSTGLNSYIIYIQDNLEIWLNVTRLIQVVDNTLPTYTSVIESANPLELGGTETITVTGVMDLSGINQSVITFGGINHTMSDLGGGSWSYDAWTPSSTGNYPYTIYLQDISGNWNATSGAIQVVDTTRPTYISVVESADPLEFGGTETIVIIGVADFSGINLAVIEFGGTNHTMTNLGNGTWRYNAWTPVTRGTNLYTLYIQDNEGNCKAIDDAIQVVDTTPPIYMTTMESADPLELGGMETITIFGVADLSGIQTALLAFEGTNHTMSNLGDGTWRYDAWIPSSTGTNSYTIYIQDTVANWNAVSGAIQVVNAILPVYINIIESAASLELGQAEMITISGVADFSGIQTVLIAFDGTNHTMIDLGNGSWCYIAWTPNATGTFPYTIYIQDNAGNWNATAGSILVFEPTPPTGVDPLIWILLIIIAGLVAFTLVNHLRLSKKIRKLPAPKVIPPKDLTKNIKTQ
jgi:hypothetical protein